MTEPRDWHEEKFFLEQEIERIDAIGRIQSGQIAVLREKLDGKQKRDLDEAHSKIRALQNALTHARLQKWVASSAASFLAVLVFELLKFIVSHR